MDRLGRLSVFFSLCSGVKTGADQNIIPSSKQLLKRNDVKSKGEGHPAEEWFLCNNDVCAGVVGVRRREHLDPAAAAPFKLLILALGL